MIGESLANPIFAEAHGERPFWPRRNWWLALLAILVLAGALRYPGYDFGLPHVDEFDVTNFFLSARKIIDFGTAKSHNFHDYPPGIIQIYYVVMRLFQDPAAPPASVLGIVRFLAVTISLGVIAIFGLYGYHAVGPVVGLFGAALWSITPLFVERSRWGSAEIWVLFFSLLALYCTTVAILYRRESWSTHATYALMLAIVFKYHCVFIAPLVLLAPLWRGRVSWKRVLANLGRFALFSFWLLFLTPVLEIFRPFSTVAADIWVKHTRVVSTVSPLTLYYNLAAALGWLNYWVLIPGWLGLGWLSLEPILIRQSAACAGFPMRRSVPMVDRHQSFWRARQTCDSFLVLLGIFAGHVIGLGLCPTPAETVPIPGPAYSARRRNFAVGAAVRPPARHSNSECLSGGGANPTGDLAGPAQRAGPSGPTGLCQPANTSLHRGTPQPSTAIGAVIPGTTPFKYEGSVQCRYHDPGMAYAGGALRHRLVWPIQSSGGRKGRIPTPPRQRSSNPTRLPTPTAAPPWSCCSCSRSRTQRPGNSGRSA